MRQGKLSIPAALTVGALGLGCPAEDGGETGSDVTTTTDAATTGGTSTGGTSTDGTTSGGTTTMATTNEEGSGTASSSGADSSSTGVDLPDCAGYEEETTCAAEALCQWVTGLGCRPDCEMLDTMHVCVTSEFCYWFEEACHTPV